ncbi:hypothetical protein HDU82_001659 [Entophlyctis luteolus]|nr:hypothetical protein HDU82_001659 [Entophlyctis luteolus]
MDNYNFDGDSVFAAGLASITAQLDSQALSVEEKALRIDQAKRFYYAKYVANTSNEQAPTVGSALPDPEPSRSTVSSEPNTAVPESTNQRQTNLTVQDQQLEMSAAPEPSYPPSFADICAMISRGEPVPGIKLIPTTVLDMSLASVPSAPQRPKPWESQRVADHLHPKTNTHKLTASPGVLETPKLSIAQQPPADSQAFNTVAVIEDLTSVALSDKDSTIDEKLYAARTETLIQMVVKVMAKLFYGGNPDIRVHSLEMLTQHYNELLALKQIITTVVQRVPMRNLKALSVTLMHALLLVHRMLNVTTSETSGEADLPVFEDDELRDGRHRVDLPQVLAGSPKRVLVAGLMLAEVGTMDCPSSSRVWGALAGMTRSEVAAGKNAALVHLQYSVHVPATELARWSRAVVDWLEKTRVKKCD